MLFALQAFSAPFHVVSSDCSMDSSSDINDSLELVLVIEVEHRFHCPNPSCTRSLKQDRHLTQHMKDCGKEGLICSNNNCGKMYKTKESFTRHVKECGQIFSCSNPGCSKSFNTEHDLSQHLRVCGGDPCPCGYAFPNMDKLGRHQTTCKVRVHFIHLLFLSLLFKSLS